MATGFSITIHDDFKQVLKLLETVVRKSQGGMRDGLDTVSRGTKAILDSLYASGGGIPPARGTLLARRFGKLARPGRPALKSYGGSVALRRSGTMINALFRKPTGKLEFTIGFNDVPGEFAGNPVLSVGHIASLQEHGYTHTVPFTKRMQTYLLLLYGRITSPEQAAKFNFRPRTMLIRVPPRPVWGRTWKEVTPVAGGWFLDSWARYVGLK